MPASPSRASSSASVMSAMDDSEIIDVDAMELDEDGDDKENNASKQQRTSSSSKTTATKVNSKRKAKASKAENNNDDDGEESDSVDVAPSKQVPSKKKQKLDPSLKTANNGKEKVAASSSSAVKTTEAVSHLVQFKNGKLLLKQKKVDWGQQNIALQKRIAWNAFLEEQEEALEAVPEEHLPLILLLAIESEKTPTELTKQIKASLCPANAVDEDSEESTSSTSSIDKLPLPVLQKAITSVAERVNHGFRDNAFFDTDDEDMNEDNEKEDRDLPEGYEVVPNGLRVWRWEIKDDYRTSSEVYKNTLSEEIRKKIESRMEERQNTRDEAKKVLASLSEKEIKEILTKGTSGKAEPRGGPAKEGKKAASTNAEDGAKPSSKAKGKKKAVKQEEGGEEAEEGDSKQEEGSDSAKPKSKGGKKKKELTAEEQAAKEAEAEAKELKKAEAAEKKRVREEKKAVKDAEKAAKDAVKAKKEEVIKKQQNFFGKFIVKTGTSPAAEDTPLPSSSAGLGTPGPSSAVQIPSSSAAASPAPVSNKDREGSAGVNATPAPAVNQLKSKKGGKSDYQIAFRHYQPRNGVALAPAHSWTTSKRKIVDEQDVEEVSAADSLKQFIAMASPSRLPSRVPLSERENLTIDYLMSSLQEAEIASDKLEASRLRSILRNTTKVPFKLLKFATDVRPGYFGTWTKKSTSINGRNPFKQDTGILEYEYDSEAEWEEDDPEAEDLVEDGPLDPEDVEEPESDLDGWLAGDDEDIEMEDGWTALDGSEEPEDASGAGQDAEKTKLKVTKTSIKKKLTGPLVPVIKGPCFVLDGSESSGDAKWLAQFSMQWLGGNEAGSLDPFVFVEKPTRLVQKAAEASSKDGETTLKAKKSLVPAGDLPLFNTTVLASSSTAKPKLLDELVAAFEIQKIKISKACLQRQMEESVSKKKKDEMKEDGCVWTIVDQKKEIIGN